MAEPQILNMPLSAKQGVLSTYPTLSETIEEERPGTTNAPWIANRFVLFGEEPWLYFFGKMEYSESQPATEEIAKQFAIKSGMDQGILDNGEKATQNITFNLLGGPTGLSQTGTTLRYILAISRGDIFVNGGSPRINWGAETTATSTAPTSNASSPTTRNPDPRNFSNRNANGDNVLQVKFGDIRLYTETLQLLFQSLQERISFYNITFDNRSFNALYYARNLNNLSSQIRGIIINNNSLLHDTDTVRIVFDNNFEKMKSVIIETIEGGETEIGVPENAFDDITTNFLIFNLSKIYNRYSPRAGNSGFQFSSAGSIFLSEDEIRSFLNIYIRPAPSVVTAGVTRSLVEKFILGDARLLDDEFYNNYQVSSQIIPSAFRANLNQQISQQYEGIGDFLGEKWLSGEFQEINSVEDYYDQVLNYIPIQDLIGVSAACLLKMIPVDELLDFICKDVLREFDAHKEAIIQELESMDDGIAKDLARELTEVYWELLDEGLDFFEEISRGLTNWLLEWIAQSKERVTWSSSSSIVEMINSIRTGMTGGNHHLIEAFGIGENSIEARRLILENDRIPNLKAERDILEERLSVFVRPSDYPENQARSFEYISLQISDLEIKKQNLEKASENVIDQMRLYNFLAPMNVNGGNYLINLQQTLRNDALQPNFHHIIPNLVVLDPYISEEEVEVIFQEESLPPITPEQAINNLNNFNTFFATQINTFNNAPPLELELTGDVGLEFVFEQNYFDKPVGERQKIFDINLENVKKIFEYINYLNGLDSAPFDVLKGISTFADQTMDEYIDTLFADETKRYYLCLAIYGSIWAVGYLIHQLIENPEEVADFFVDQASAIYDGFSKRLEMFGRTDYPVLDILSELSESLMQLGKNFARDLLVSGIMATIGSMREMCEDVDKVNAPYNPIGAIDLSSFIINSRKGTNNTRTGNIEESNSYKNITISTGISANQFREVLRVLSLAFSINEMCLLLENKGNKKLHLKAVAALDTLDFLKGTLFHTLYANEIGIIELFRLLSNDIEPAFCAQAKDNFDKQKAILLEICFGRDDTFLEQVLCKDKTPAECLKLLASKASAPSNLLDNLINQVNDMFKDNVIPDPCADGKGIFDDTQKHSADIIGNSIFGGIESNFEADISRVKNIYNDTNTVFKNLNSQTELRKNIIISSLEKDPDETFQASLEEQLKTIETSQGKVAIKILQQVANDINQLGIERVIEPNPDPEDFGNLNPTKLQFIKDIHDSDEVSLLGDGRQIRFDFDSSASPNTTLQISTIGEVPEVGDAPAVTKVIATYSADKFQEIENKEERKPDKLYNEVILSQPDYNSSVRSIMKEVSIENDYYLRLLNSIFKDLYATSFKTGLYNKEEFNELNLNKHVSTLFNKCFLGFMNKKTLNKQMQSLADRLTCYAPLSSTKGPVNVATVKVALDCLIRTIAVKELMKSLFVYGIFPTELKLDDEKSFYDQFINREIEISLTQRFINSGTSSSNFYNTVIKEFITDVMRILYQKEDLTPDQSFDLLKDTQVEFAKQQMLQTMSPLIKSSIDNISEYQMLESVLNPVSGSDAFLDLETLSYIDQVQALQNDYFTLYSNGDTFLGESQITEVSFDDPVLYPTFTRDPKNPVLFYNYKTLELETSLELPTILQGINDGIVLEKMIEVKQKDFAPTEENKQELEDFLYALGSPVIMGSSGRRSDLKKFLYATKLIMLFPQLRDVVNSLEDINGMWKDYLDGSGQFDLFRTMYLYNSNPDAFNLFDFKEKLDWSLMGKMYTNDFEVLIDEFPVSGDFILSFISGTGFEFKENWGDGQNLLDWIFSQPVNNIVEINTVIRLSSYINQPDESDLDDFKSNFEVHFGTTKEATKTLLQEKIGKVDFRTEEDTSSYLCIPIFESKKSIINQLTWSDFFLNYDKSNYRRVEFYNDLFTWINQTWGGSSNWRPNDILFPQSSSPTAEVPSVDSPFAWDVFSYFYRFKALTGLNTETQKIFVTRYKSTEWFNIQGIAFTKEEILEHVESGGSKKLSGRDFDRIEYDNNPFAYLTDASLASLQENASLFFNVPEDDPNNINKFDPISKTPKNVIIYENSQDIPIPGTNPTGDYTKGFAALKVRGTWDIKNPQTGEVVVKDAPKYILLRTIYVPTTPGQDSRYIDFGWMKNPSNATIPERISCVDIPLIGDVCQGQGDPIAAGINGIIFAESSWATKSIEYNKTYPGATFSNEIGWDLYNDRKAPVGVACTKEHCEVVGHWANSIKAGEYYSPWHFGNKHTWLLTPQELGRERDQIAHQIQKTGLYGTQWYSGWVTGGLVSAQTVQEPMPINENTFSAYKLFGRMIGSPADHNLFKTLLKSFFIKEQTTIIALIHKLYAEKYYPQLETNFDASINSAMEALLAAVATANGDYRYTSAANSTAGLGTDADLDFGAIAGQLLSMFLGAMANTVDPTWKTGWFTPGPFTPFGVAAKLLDENGDIFTSGPDAINHVAIPEPAVCDEAYEAQVKLLNDLINSD